MGLHAQSFAAMPLRPALAEVIYDLLDEERSETFDRAPTNNPAQAECSQPDIDDDEASASPGTMAVLS